jgi:hypothetical protein
MNPEAQFALPVEKIQIIFQGRKLDASLSLGACAFCLQLEALDSVSSLSAVTDVKIPS